MRGARAQAPGGHCEMQDTAPAAARLRGSGFRDWFRSVVPNDIATPAADHHELPPFANSPQAEPLPAPSSPDLTRLEKQLKFLTTQLEIMRSPCRADALIAELRQQLATIAQAIENVVSRSAFQALEDEVRVLGARLDVNRINADGAAIAALEQGLAEIRSAVRGLTPVELDHVVQTLSRKIDQINEAGPDPLIFRQLDTAIDALRDIVSQIASGEAIAVLAKEVRALGEKVEQAAGGGSAPALSSDEIVLALEKQISGMVDALAHSTQADRATSPIEPLIETIAQKLDHFDLLDGKSALEPIKQHIDELGEKIDSLQAPPYRSVALAPLEQRLNDLANAIERLNAPFAQLPSLAPIEERLSALAEKLDRIESNSRLGGNADLLEERTSVFETRSGAPQVGERGIELKSSAAPAPNALAAATTLAHDAPREPGSGPPYGRAAAAVSDRAAAAPAAPRAVVSNRTEKSPAWPNFIVAARRAARAASEPAPHPASVTDSTDHAAAGVVTRNLAARVKSLFLSTSLILVGLGAAGIALSSADLLGVGRQKTADRLVGAAQVANSKVASAEVASSQTTAPKSGAPAQANAPSSPAAEPTPPSDAVAAALPDPKPTSDVSATAPVEQGLGTSQTPIPEPRPARIADLPTKLAAAPGSADSAPLRREAARPSERPVPKNVPSDVTASITPQHTTARTAVPQPSSKSADSAGVWSETLPTAIATKSILAGIAERNPAAAYEVAMRYLEGRGVTNDSATGAVWLARAAEGGITPAQFRLGSMYEKGVGVKRNLIEARRLYIAAAAKGHATAMHNAAVLYAEGIDGQPDHAAAAEWFQKAAEYGVTDSQYNLAVLYARGLGVERNFAESYKWFAIAAEKGDKDAARKRDELAAQLDSQTLAAAERAASAFTPNPQPESATAVSRPAGGWEDSGLGRSKPHLRSQGQQARLSAQPPGD